MNNSIAKTKLDTILASIRPGPIRDTKELEQLLAEVWDEFTGDGGGMKPYKLLGRTENMTWKPPYLTFTIERHGATVLGSTRATLQDWTLDLEKMAASCFEERHRQVRPRQARLDVGPLAEEIASLIVKGKKDPRLKWNDEGSVRVLVGEILPEGSAAKQTLVGRRKRFREALSVSMAGRGWDECGVHRYAKRRENGKRK
jgi:hypothetical protein